MRLMSSSNKRRARRMRGFTLPELMVALVAGLLVTLAVVGLARSATNTFYEQMRTTGAEMSLRIASHRLSSDLSRAGYMGTGNIRFDPGIARRALTPDPAADSGSRYLELINFASLRLHLAGSAEAGLLDLESDNGLRPEALDIAGNFTSNDQYLGTIGPGASCGNQRMTLNADDPAVMRMVLSADGTTTRSDTDTDPLVRAIFQPVAGSRFPARVTDPSGKSHIVIVCQAGVTGGQAYVEFANATTGNAVLTGSETGGKGGFDGYEQLQVAPLQVVRWNIQRRVNARLDPAQNADIKFDLFRSLLDASGVVAGEPELIAEYIVDLKFAFTVDQTPVVPAAAGFDFENETENQIWTTLNGVSAATTSVPGPQRIRSVRYRLAGRAALPDRNVDLPGPGSGFIHRYCLTGTPATCKSFARVRTIVSEVALMNQARMTY